MEKSREERIKEHDEKVRKAFERAENGEIINLTDLMISKLDLIREELDQCLSESRR